MQFAYLAYVGMRTKPDKGSAGNIVCTLVLPVGVWPVALPRIPLVVRWAKKRVDFATYVNTTEGAAAHIEYFYKQRGEPNPYLSQ